MGRPVSPLPRRQLSLNDAVVIEESSTIVFFPEGAFGPTNNCVGIGDVLRRRGHRVVFIVEESFAGTLEAQGFEERLMRLTPPPETEEAPGQFWKDFIRETAPVFRNSTTEQLADFIAPTFEALIDGAKYVDDRLREIIDELEPDLIVEDNVVSLPGAARPAGGRGRGSPPATRPRSRTATVPPPFSGLPSDDRSGWDEYWDAYRAAHREMHADFSEFCRERGAPPLPADDFIHESPWLNLYLYPDEVDYRRARPLGPTWHNLQASVRATDPAWELPEQLRDGEEPLIYLSLGSLGSADVDADGEAGRRAGRRALPRHRLQGPAGRPSSSSPPNMAGDEFLPQTEILPKVDLVITHGGNNTVTESLYFGKPMVVLPIFWDQHDNAQRIDETGFGIRLDTYRHSAEELTGAIERLLGDEELAARLAQTSRAPAAAPAAPSVAADLIEQVAR